jgi:hypothetical protein
MGYLPNFDEDVFISYAHNDDDVFPPEEWGWVTRLHQDLERRVRSYLGADVHLWRDCEIRNNEDFSKKILNRLMRTATFLSVLSPSFLQRDWCRRELESFTGHAEAQMGLLIGEDRSRIFKIEKIPVERSALPPAMQATKTYRFFYQPDPAQPNRSKELRPQLGGEYLRRYFEEMDELAKDIAALLKSMAQSTAAGAMIAKPNQQIVYLAETTSDLDDKFGELRRDLKDRGYVVLPDRDLPFRADAYKQSVRELLRQAVLSVHLVGAGYGFVPEGETKSNVWLQHDLAMERGADPTFLRLIWLPRDVSASDRRQRDFITYLHDDVSAVKGADLLNGNIEELKTVIRDRLIKFQKQGERSQFHPTVTAPGSGGTPGRSADELQRVYIICDLADLKSASLSALRKHLLAQGVEPMLPALDDRESEAMLTHRENLGLCDGCVIFYGQGSSAWFDAKLRDLRKHLRGRQPPVVAKAIYIAQPQTDHKSEVETLEAMVLREGASFSFDVIAQFLQKLQAPT